MGNGIGIIESLVRFYRCVSTCAAGDRWILNIFHIYNIFQHFQHFQHFSTFLVPHPDDRTPSSEVEAELQNVKHDFAFSKYNKKDRPVFMQHTPTIRKPLAFKNHCIFNIFQHSSTVFNIFQHFSTFSTFFYDVTVLISVQSSYNVYGQSWEMESG